MSPPVAEVIPASRGLRRPRRGLFHLTAMTRAFVLLSAMGVAATGVLWLKQETPHPGGAAAMREAPLAEARSLKPLLETAQPPGLAPYALRSPSSPAAPAKPAAAAPKPMLKASAQWPREVALAGMPEVIAVPAEPGAKEFLYRTEHFEFSCDAPLGAETVRHFSRAFEATHMLNCLLPLDLKPAPEGLRKMFRARIFNDPAAFAAAGGGPGSAGFYSLRDKCVYAPVASLGVTMAGGRAMLDASVEANDTLVHEITHQMMNRWLPLLPVWLVEGAAEYVAAAEFAQGRFLLGKMQERLKHRLRGRGARQMEGGAVRIGALNVAELLALTGKAWNAGLGTPAANENYASALLLTYYLYHLDRGRQGAGTIAMLRAVEKGMPHQRAVSDFILAGRHPAEFEGEMGLAFARIGVELQFTKRGGAVFKP